VNGGYAYANNLGLREADARYSLLLNPDTVLPPRALSEMIAFMDAHPDAGVAGPRLVLQDGSLDKACRRSFPSPQISLYRLTGLSSLFPKSPRFGRYNMTHLDPDVTTEVDSVVGAFMLVRSEAIEQAGLLDESFFMYGEDLDWAYRIKEAGWKVYYHADVTVLHYKRASSQHSLKAQVEFYRAMLLFFRKHYAANTPFWLTAMIVAGIYLFGAMNVARYWLRARLQGRSMGAL
jgi:N-acetylglucosaminyl-diphospho-decaprenol L-rhamnosyltransferase